MLLYAVGRAGADVAISGDEDARTLVTEAPRGV
jgi:hypothetical protein